MNDVVREKLEDLAVICQGYGVSRLSLFGSALTRDFDPERSDLDFLVKFEAMPLQDHAAAFFGLLGALEELFGRRVDLLEEHTLRNPYVRRSIEQHQELLYAAA